MMENNDSYVPSIGEIIDNLKTKPMIINGHVNIIAVHDKLRKYFVND